MTRAAALALAAGCAGEGPRAGAPNEPPAALAVALVDSVPYENELTGGWLRRVQVTYGARVDTLDGVLTASAPVAAGDTAVVGLLGEEHRVVGVFVYDARARALRRLPVPRDWAGLSTPKLAPDGAHVAYVGRDPRDTVSLAYGVVAAVPSMREVLRGPAAPPLETDAGVDSIAWLDADRVEIRIDRTYLLGGALRLRGTVRPPRLLVDTVDAAPR